MQGVVGYSGFRRIQDRDPVPDKPGDSPTGRSSKFARGAIDIVYGTPPSTDGGVATSNM